MLAGGEGFLDQEGCPLTPFLILVFGLGWLGSIWVGLRVERDGSKTWRRSESLRMY